MFIFNSPTIVLIDLHISKKGIKPRKNADKQKIKNHQKVKEATYRQDVNQLYVYVLFSKPERSECFIEDQAFSPSYALAPSPPPSRQ
jgi:hypothetical protein